ncbi:hypothetical protein I3760_15G140500 [Carya illinoinensis]|nr:hypothetical protein I3760_15G140500 [Carya illinoinensis]
MRLIFFFQLLMRSMIYYSCFISIERDKILDINSIIFS